MAALPQPIEPEPEPDQSWCPACDGHNVKSEEIPGWMRGGKPLVRVRYECMDCGAVEVIP